MSRYPFRRRNFLIKKEFQGKFILIFALSLIGLSGLITWVLAHKIQNALEWHIYSSHLRVERTGDFMLGLLIQTNLAAILAILALVTIVSLIVVQRLNRHFGLLGATVDAMSQGDFNSPVQPVSRFHEITNLINLVAEMKVHYRDKFVSIHEVLIDLDAACVSNANDETLRQHRNRLDSLIRKFSLPD